MAKAESMDRSEVMKRLVLQKIKMGCERSVSKEMLDTMKVEVAADWMYGMFRMHLRAWTTGNQIMSRTSYEHVPLTWWDAFKAEWFPRWWLSRWPIRTRAIETIFTLTHVCPHLPITSREGVKEHFEFLTPPV